MTLIQRILAKRSFLCVGLDPDRERIPEEMLAYEDPNYEFNRRIIEATKDHCVAYKPNLAFYEREGASGWETLRKTIQAIPDEHFVIADAKRGDIGNTSLYYARSFFETLGADAVTLSPYMGHDSVRPYLSFKGKWALILALTSNEGALDLQFLPIAPGHQKLYEKVIEKGCEWGSIENTMFVVGATHGELLQKVRAQVPDHFLFVPGVGTQGGELSSVIEHAMTSNVGLLVNMSRSIIYASSGSDFEEKAREKAAEAQGIMAKALDEKLT
jgi:orotidine-5'-phosphate decarboxylase